MGFLVSAIAMQFTSTKSLPSEPFSQPIGGDALDLFGYVSCIRRSLWLMQLFLFVDDFMLLQRKDVLPLTAAFVCSLMQVFGLPISWRKADLHCAIDWIGWRFNFSIGVVYLQERKGSKLLDWISQMLSHSRIPKKFRASHSGSLRFFRRCGPVCITCFLIFTHLPVHNTQWIRAFGPLQYLAFHVHCVFLRALQVQLSQRVAN